VKPTTPQCRLNHAYFYVSTPTGFRMCSHSGWLSCSPVFLLCFIVIPAKFALFCYRSNFCDPSGSTLPRVKNNNNKRTYLSSCPRTLTTWHCPHSPAAVAAYSSNRSISPASRAHSSKPAADRQTDRQTDEPFHRSTLYRILYASSANR